MHFRFRHNRSGIATSNYGCFFSFPNINILDLMVNKSINSIYNSVMDIGQTIAYPNDRNPSHSFDLMIVHNANRSAINHEL